MQRSVDEYCRIVCQLASFLVFTILSFSFRKGVEVGIGQNEGSDTTSLGGELIAFAFEVLKVSSLVFRLTLAHVCVHR